MAQDPLVKYVKDTLKQGYVEDDIRSHLLEHGYEEKQVNRAIHDAKHTHVPHHFLLIFGIVLLIISGIGFFYVTQINGDVVHIPNADDRPEEIAQLESAIQQIRDEGIPDASETEEFEIPTYDDVLDCGSTDLFAQNVPLSQLEPELDEGITCFGDALTRCRPAELALEHDSTELKLNDECEIIFAKDAQQLLCPRQSVGDQNVSAFFQVYNLVYLEFDEQFECTMR
ncbi:MAG: hypothetical protein ACMXYA_02055 [Candidatus Woesearchaeota archaeon]